MNIILTGMMGSGKSTVGRYLASHAGMDYIDLDELIVSRTGMDINTIFEKMGEPEFRKMETEAVEYVSGLDGVVVSTGGGVVKSDYNMQQLEKNGTVICLWADEESIYERIKDDDTRPLLRVDNPKAAIAGIIEKRRTFYSRCSLMVNTAGKNIEDIADEILSYFKKESADADKS